MKKKNLLKTLSVLTLTGVLAFALSGCQILVPHEDGKNDDGNSGEVGYPTGSAKDITSEKIETEAAWKAAFADSNFENFAMKQEMSVTAITEEVKSVVMATSMVGKVAGKISYAEATVTMMGTTATSYVYADESGKTPVIYKKVGEGKWALGKESDSADINDSETMQGFAALYSEYEYNDEEKGYVVKEDSTVEIETPYVLKFQSGKIVGMYYYSLESMQDPSAPMPTDDDTTDPTDPGTNPGDNNDDDEPTPSTPETKMETVVDTVLSYGGQKVEIPAEILALSTPAASDENEDEENE